MPHINYKRGETRKTQRTVFRSGDKGCWTWFKRNSHRVFRNRTNQIIRHGMANDNDWEESLFPYIYDEVDDWWNYD
jgi:hypothetical protein